MRISIIGHSGSGKTILAKEISESFSIKHIQLDRFWFEAGGLDIMNKKSPEFESEHERVRRYIKKNILKAISSDSWVSDGFYSNIQPEIANKADVVIFLDTPLWRRLLNQVKRVIGQADRHSELNAWNEFTFFFEIIRRHFAFRPKFQEFFSKYKNKVVTLRSRQEIREYVNTLHT